MTKAFKSIVLYQKYIDNGIKNNHHVHSLKQLSRFFFDKPNTTITIETAEQLYIIKDIEDGKTLTIKEDK